MIVHLQPAIGTPGQVGLAAGHEEVDMALDTVLASLLNLSTVFRLVLVPKRIMAFATHSLARRVKSMSINEHSLEYSVCLKD